MTSLKWHLSNKQPARSEVASPNDGWGKHIPDENISKCKGPELGMCLEYWKNRGPLQLERSEHELEDKGMGSEMWGHWKQNLKRLWLVCDLVREVSEDWAEGTWSA